MSGHGIRQDHDFDAFCVGRYSVARLHTQLTLCCKTQYYISVDSWYRFEHYCPLAAVEESNKSGEDGL